MTKNIRIGIDIGSYMIRVTVAEYFKDNPYPTILGTGSALSSGIKRGFVSNHSSAKNSLNKALAEATKNTGIKIKRAVVDIGSVSLISKYGIGMALTSKADLEVNELDVKKAIDESAKGIILQNERVLHVVPVAYKLDGKEVLGRPEGLSGVKLEVKTLFITATSQHVDDIIKLVTDCGIDVITTIACPLPASILALNDRQKNAGVAIVDIGAETTKVCVYENNNLISLQSFPFGSLDITNDIALGFQIPLDEAEEVKIGSFIGNHSRKKLDEIVDARLTDIFELVDTHFKKIKRSGLLPAGVVIIGGGSNAYQVTNIAKQVLKIPAQVASSSFFTESKNKIKDATWFTSIGLTLTDEISANNEDSDSVVLDFLKNVKKAIKSSFHQFIP